jgi:Nucleotidyl transferase AbiEii toxin, Type IV TA system
MPRMDDFAVMAATERRDIVRQAASNMRLDFTIIEKDFWVCWVLGALFDSRLGHAPLIFKGGTSLSKAYGLIRRFSEDIDIVTEVSFFLNRGAADPENASSTTQRRKRIEALDAACAAYIRDELLPALRSRFAERLGPERWDLDIDSSDHLGHTLLFRYPTTDPGAAHSYIRERVKIELGWRSASNPNERRALRPYVADQFPTLMAQPTITTVVLSVERTFWEKVTALHAESFRERLLPFFSRHYSDVAEIFATDAGRAAAEDHAMLETVRTYKQRYYTSAWARYDLAVRGSLVVVPHDEKLSALAADYRAMEGMFFVTPPPFDAVIERLRELEAKINAN